MPEQSLDDIPILDDRAGDLSFIEAGTPKKILSHHIEEIVGERHVLRPEVDTVVVTSTNGENQAPKPTKLITTDQPQDINEVLGNNSNHGFDYDAMVKNDFTAIDENRVILRKYFHDLLRYINKTDASLYNDRDCALELFVSKIPDNELDMDFKAWLEYRIDLVKREFSEITQKKKDILKEKLEHSKEVLKEMTEDALLEIAKDINLDES